MTTNPEDPTTRMEKVSLESTPSELQEALTAARDLIGALKNFTTTLGMVNGRLERNKNYLLTTIVAITVAFLVMAGGIGFDYHETQVNRHDQMQTALKACERGNESHAELREFIDEYVSHLPPGVDVGDLEQQADKTFASRNCATTTVP